jgi:hypothetical protein
MDVSTDILYDPKVRKLYRLTPDHASTAFTVYVATIGESWKVGKRVSAQDAWPAFMAFDQTSIDALIEVGLLDKRGHVPSRSWRGWFETAADRRSRSRERWARYNAKRDEHEGDTASLPRGTNVDTATSVPPVRPSVPTVPPPPPRGNDVGYGPAPPRLSTVDRDPHLKELRAALRATEKES